MNKIVVTFIKETLIEVLISTVLLAIISFIILKMMPGIAIVKIMILAVYCISTFVGGYIMGSVMNRRKFIWGALAGLVYFIIIFLGALIVKGEIPQGPIGVTEGLVASVLAGMIGGMIS